MRTGLIPITFALWFAAPAAGCGGASADDVREAKSSGYRGDFAVIYSETLAAVRELYPELVEDARLGIIKTPWYPVHVKQGTDDAAQANTVTPGTPRTAFSTTSALRQEFFIRFDVHVVGGRPWRVRVQGEASSWKAGENPTPLRGPEIPSWLEGRVNSLEVAIHKRLKKHAVELTFAPATEVKPAAKPIDTAKFGSLPKAAALVVAEVERAASARDVARLRGLMVSDFTYSTGDEPSAETAMVVWQADPSLLGELVKVLEAGCAHDPAKGQVVCPAAFLRDESAPGYRAGFRLSDGSWKMAFFVNGE